MGGRRFLKNIHPRLGTPIQTKDATTTAKPVNISGGVTAPSLGFVLAVGLIQLMVLIDMQTNLNI